MLGLVITTLIFIGALIGFSKILDTQKIKKDWPKYRCRPDVMFMADFYGHNASENIEFCLQNGFQERAKEALGPFYTYLGKFVEILMTLLKSINSIRMIFATIIGSVTQVFSEFSTRIQSFMYTIQSTSIRIKFLMGRVFATMYAVIFMGMSGIKATTNFGNTFLFKFLDTFCFDPDTKIILQGGKEVCVKDVVIGDVFQSGDKVTATFEFFADGQPMVKLPGSNLNENILVSTNHYLLHNGKWIQSREHPDAIPSVDWSGGFTRPLICFNTNTHKFTIDSYIFRDYDESEEGDKKTMKAVLEKLNNTKEESVPNTYNTVIAPKTKLKTNYGLIPADKICLGTPLKNGTVVGIVKKECNFFVNYNGEIFGEGTCIWSNEEKKWIRPTVTSIRTLSRTFYSFVVSPSACIETEAGTVVRDYVEIHSPDTEEAYTKALHNAA
jgi:hypothetical protein